MMLHVFATVTKRYRVTILASDGLASALRLPIIPPSLRGNP
jgi:hypothetical protein